MNDETKLLSITDLFDKKERYVIPIYQRNYAWGESEVKQLIQDVVDMSKEGEISHYFIGSIVVYQRETQNEFETIDGQQRHTTLSILLSVLKNEFKQGIDIECLNLSFDSRPKSKRTLDAIFSKTVSELPEEKTIRAAYEFAKTKITQLNNDDGLKIETFTKYLLENVKILRVKVPSDTDLNHYFEIMNNRGEQLEKHEIIKARMMGALKDDESAQICFAKVWDACADMNRFVQLGFDKKYRESLFGKDWNNCPKSFESVQRIYQDVDELDSTESKAFSTELGNVSLADIIAAPKLSAEKSDKTPKQYERFDALIDFPNFLLQVLKVISKEDVTLDDKKLLGTFSNNKITSGVINPKEFILQLLKCRMLFDRYIIKRDHSKDSEENWSLLRLKNDYSYLNTVQSDNNTLNKELVMVQSMFHFSFPSQNYKNWLASTLTYLNEEGVANTETLQIDTNCYLSELESISDAMFNERYNAKDEASVLHCGTGVANFIFNRLDYLLWKTFRLTDNLPYELDNPEYVKERLRVFRFKHRTSVEHYYPQSPKYGALKLKAPDRLGNLCLISVSSNSTLRNDSPEEKKSYYKDLKTTESLKQAFMMSYQAWGPDEQGLKNIEDHQTMMIDVLCSSIA